MSSLVSTVIRQDREDKAVAAVHHPKTGGEDQMKASHQLQDEAVHLGNGNNGVSLDTDVMQPASPSNRVSRLFVGWGEVERAEWMGKHLILKMLLWCVCSFWSYVLCHFNFSLPIESC